MLYESRHAIFRLSFALVISFPGRSNIVNLATSSTCALVITDLVACENKLKKLQRCVFKAFGKLHFGDHSLKAFGKMSMDMDLL